MCTRHAHDCCLNGTREFAVYTSRFSTNSLGAFVRDILSNRFPFVLDDFISPRADVLLRGRATDRRGGEKHGGEWRGRGSEGSTTSDAGKGARWIRIPHVHQQTSQGTFVYQLWYGKWTSHYACVPAIIIIYSTLICLHI